MWNYRYKVVAAEDIESVEIAVQEYVRRGWYTRGSLHSAFNPVKRRFLFTQVVEMHEGDPFEILNRICAWTQKTRAMEPVESLEFSRGYATCEGEVREILGDFLAECLADNCCS